jgi:hypothetical protein
MKNVSSSSGILEGKGNPTHKCKNCYLGGFDDYDPNKRQLFAIPVVLYQKYDNSNFVVLDELYYPDSNRVAIYFLEVINPDFNENQNPKNEDDLKVNNKKVKLKVKVNVKVKVNTYK